MECYPFINNVVFFPSYPEMQSYQYLNINVTSIVTGKNDKMYPFDFLLINIRIYVHDSIVK